MAVELDLIPEEECRAMAWSVPPERVREIWEHAETPDEYILALDALEAVDAVYGTDRAKVIEDGMRKWAAVEVGAAIVSTYGSVRLALDGAGICVENSLFAEVTAWRGGHDSCGAWRVIPWETLFRGTVEGSDMEDPRPGETEHSGAAARRYAEQLRAMADRFEKIADVLEG